MKFNSPTNAIQSGIGDSGEGVRLGMGGSGSGAGGRHVELPPGRDYPESPADFRRRAAFGGRETRRAEGWGAGEGVTSEICEMR